MEKFQLNLSQLTSFKFLPLRYICTGDPLKEVLDLHQILIVEFSHIFNMKFGSFYFDDAFENRNFVQILKFIKN